jgi:hypothetical protein
MSLFVLLLFAFLRSLSLAAEFSLDCGLLSPLPEIESPAAPGRRVLSFPARHRCQDCEQKRSVQH